MTKSTTSIETRPISIDVYNETSVHVFVHGYAINRNESTYSVAYDLAKKFNQDEITVTTYGNGLPEISKVKVNVIPLLTSPALNYLKRRCHTIVEF